MANKRVGLQSVINWVQQNKTSRWRLYQNAANSTQSKGSKIAEYLEEDLDESIGYLIEVLKGGDGGRCNLRLYPSASSTAHAYQTDIVLLPNETILYSATGKIGNAYGNSSGNNDKYLDLYNQERERRFEQEREMDRREAELRQNELLAKIQGIEDERKTTTDKLIEKGAEFLEQNPNIIGLVVNKLMAIASPANIGSQEQIQEPQQQTPTAEQQETNGKAYAILQAAEQIETNVEVDVSQVMAKIAAMSQNNPEGLKAMLMSFS